MPLEYLIFDASDDGEGTGTWEAMASVHPDALPSVLTEVQTVLTWAEANQPGPRGPLDDGGAWDGDLQQTTDGDRTRVTLTITGPWAWGEALVRQVAETP